MLMSNTDEWFCASEPELLQFRPSATLRDPRATNFSDFAERQKLPDYIEPISQVSRREADAGIFSSDDHGSASDLERC